MRKIYKYNNNIYYFSHNSFNNLFYKKCKKEEVNIKDMEKNLADAIHVSKDTIHSWRCNTYSPNDINLVGDIAKFFGYSINMFLCREGDGDRMVKLLDNELMSVKRIYESIIEFLEYFYKTNGFNDLWFKLDNISVDQREDKLWKIAEEEHDKVLLCLKKEYPIIKNNQIYKDLSNYIYNDLYDIYDGKLSYGYRFEAPVDGNPTADQDYAKAYKAVNDIIDKYC